MLWLWLACTEPTSVEETPKQTLIEASQEVIFASTEILGAHRLRSVYRQSEYHGEDLRNEHQEVLSIDWVDWDHWQVVQSVDGEVVTQVIIMDGVCLEQVAGKFVKRPDGEPFRVQLRSMWNQWDGLMRHFEPHTTWVNSGTESMEDRTVHKYTAQFTPPTDQRGIYPSELTSTVWVDEQSAVRLAGKIDSVLLQGPYKKTQSLTVERSDIGGNAVGERLASQWSQIQVLQDQFRE